MKTHNPQERISTKLLLLVFVSCFIFYCLIWSGHHYSIDGVVMFQYAKALLFDHSLFMDPPVVWGDFDFVVSKWAIGLTLAYIPILAFLSVTFFQGNPQLQEIPYIPGERFNIELLANPPYQYSSFLNPILTAATAVILLMLAYRLGFSRKQAFITAMVFALISPASVYTKFDFAQPLASFLLLLAFYIFILSQDNGSRKALLLAGLVLGFAVLVRTEFLFVPVPLFLIAAYFSKDRSHGDTLFLKRVLRVAVIGFPIVFFVLVNLYLNYIRFGSLFSVGYSPASEFSFNISQIATAAIGNLISPGRGILLFCPLILFSVIGFAQALKQDKFKALFISAIVVGMFIFYSTWRDWGGGVSWGPRFLIPIVPFFVLMSMWGYYSLNTGRSKFVRISFLSTLLLGCVATVQGLLFDFLDFYSKIQLPPSEISQGNYNFQFQYSPIFAGWKNLSRPAKYDIFWLQQITGPTEPMIIAVVSLLLVLLVGLLVYTWLRELEE